MSPSGTDAGKGRCIAAACINNLHLVLNEVRPRCSSCRGDNALDLVWLERVVGVDETNEVTTTVLERRVQCGGLSTIFLEDGNDSVAIRSDHVARVVGRSIVHDDRLDARKRLGEDAFDRLTVEAEGWCVKNKQSA